MAVMLGSMETLVTFIIVTFAAMRVTRLVVEDKIMEPFRAWVVDKAGSGSLTAFLFFCPWCLGFWVCLPAAVVLWNIGGMAEWVNLPWWMGVPGIWFALSYLVGWALSKESN